MSANFKGLSKLATLLVVLNATSSGCSQDPPGKTTAPVGDERGDTGGDAREPSPKAEAMRFEGPGTLLPRDVSGWSISSAPRYFGPDNLYDLINGGAEIYTLFGLVGMVTADYRDAGGTLTLTAEIYDMGTLLGAFGRTARFTEGLANPADAGKGLDGDLASKAIMGDGDLVFWRDRYLVHLTLLDESPGASAESISAAGAAHLPAFARAISAAIPNDPPIPEIFSRFPTDSRIARSEAFTPDDLLGAKGLGKGYSVRYAKGETTWTAFATEESGDQAMAAAWDAVRGVESQGRRVVVKAAGARLVGLAQDGGPPMTDALVEAFTKSLVEAFQVK